MVEVTQADRKSAVLTPSSLACLSNVATVNLTAGCAHGCLYCYGRGYSTYPGENRIVLYANTLEKLRTELPRKRKTPLAIYFSPSSDFFQPVTEVLDMGYEILDFLFRMKQRVSFLTKGKIPRRHMELLKANALSVHAGIGLSTLDEKLAGIFEPNAASPGLRIAQAKELTAAGILTQVRLDPILPGLTDDAGTLEDVCQAVAGAGVRNIAASVLFLRPAVAKSLKRNIQASDILEKLLGRFDRADRLDIHAERSSVIALGMHDRRSVYSRLTQIAARHGIAVHVCACKNPDITNAPCSIAGRWPARSTTTQHRLFS